MKKFLVTLFVVALVFGVTNAYALDLGLGQNITIWDKMGSACNTGSCEDQEVEPNDRTGQAWDLEAFFLNSSTNVLTLVGGFDFKDGYGGWRSGDIFINYRTSAPTYGNPGIAPSSPSGDGTGTLSNNAFGWDYALRMDFSGNAPQGTLYALTESSALTSGYYRQNDGSNPWRTADTRNQVWSGSFNYYSNLTDSEVAGLSSAAWGAQGDQPFTGEGPHYAVQFNLNDIFVGGYLASPDNYFHFTMECGNDNIIGKDPVPEPSTVLLLGAGLLGLAAFGRKHFNQK